MTLRTMLSWWLLDLSDYLRAWRPRATPVQGREGRMVAFSKGGGNMGYPSYTCYARRGGFAIGHIEWRNQWGTYAFYPTKDGVSTPLNREIIAEIYAMLKELRS